VDLGFHVTPKTNEKYNTYASPAGTHLPYANRRTPQFIYVASNLGKLSGFCVGKNLRLSSTNE
jgi:hypothetical protein